MIFFVIVACLVNAQIGASILGDGFTTLVDHFNPQEHESVHFPYEYNLDNYRYGGPLFFYINDGLTYTNEWINKGLVYDVASNVQGALFTTDHRYFRHNLPTKTVSFDDLKYLTVEQSLADINTFINTVKEQINATDSKVFVWGTGYGGTLATLARQKYPNTIDAVWSTNGIFEPTVFNENYFDQLAKNIQEIGGNECLQRLTDAFSAIEDAIISNDDNLLVKEFSICRPFNTSINEDTALFVEGVLDLIDQYIQTNQRSGVEHFCSNLNALPLDPLKSLARWIRYEHNGDLYRCSNYDYNGKIRWLSDTDWHNPGTSTGLRQWAYLQCTQIGQFRTITSSGPFGHRLNEAFYFKLCKDTFGSDYHFERLFDIVDLFRWVYGGKNPGITNALFTHGNLDGFLHEAITEYNNTNSSAIEISHSSKNVDLSSIQGYDSAALYLAKRQIINFVNQWATN